VIEAAVLNVAPPFDDARDMMECVERETKKVTTILPLAPTVGL